MLYRQGYNSKLYYWTSNASSNVTDATDDTSNAAYTVTASEKILATLRDAAAEYLGMPGKPR